MKNIYTFLLLIGIFFSATAQKALPENNIRPQALPLASEDFLPGSFNPYSIEQLILSRYYLQNGYDLVLLEEKNSKTGKHLYYQLQLNDVPVYLAQIQAHLNNDGSMQISYPLVQAPQEKAPAVQPDYNHLLASNSVIDYSAPEENFYLHNGKLLPVKKLNLYGSGGLQREVILYGDSVLVNSDLRKFNSDSTVSGYVFYPDPLSSANVNYGGQYRDFGDANNNSLSAERVLVNFKANYNQGLFTLNNAYLEIVDYDAPNIAPATSSTPNFLFERDQSGFEDVNTFYHITEFKLFVDSLGHSGLPGFKVDADAHAISGADQSWYSPNIQTLAFGDGGVDDAEDADVIIHEYGHAIIDGAVAGISSQPNERAALEEAICDFFAVSYTKKLSPNHTNRVFNWDGHNEFWPGRMATSLKNYQFINFATSIYAHTDLMASCLREIEMNLGMATANDIILEALYRLQNSSTYVDFANSVVTADQLLNGGANFQVIVTAFQRRNVLAADFSVDEHNNALENIKLYNSHNFALGGTALLIANDKIETYTLYNTTGSIVAQQSDVNQNQVEISSASLPAGVYVLHVVTDSGLKESFKLMRQ